MSATNRQTAVKAPEAPGDGLRLRSAITHNTSNMVGGRLWYSYHMQRLHVSALSDGDRHKLATLDVELTNEALSLLRAREWVGEGFRSGATHPERPACSWWQKPVELDLWNETAEWNGVQLHGLMIYGAADAPAFATDPGRQRYSKGALAAWFLLRVNTWPKDAPFPSETTDLRDAETYFDSVPRGEFRVIRRTKVPESWQKPGPRRGR
jgi:hypothetical protein